MDHKELMDQINKRLDTTDEKVDRNNSSLEDLKAEVHRYNLKTAVLETQMAGVVRIGIMVLAAMIGIIVFVFKRGI